MKVPDPLRGIEFPTPELFWLGNTTGPRLHVSLIPEGIELIPSTYWAFSVAGGFANEPAHDNTPEAFQKFICNKINLT
jgi:hypothetical protein